MRFADVLPHLEAGRRVRRPFWGAKDYIASVMRVVHDETGKPWLGLSELEHLLASDWEVVEEPAPAKPDGVPACSSCGEHPSAVYCKKCCPHDQRGPARKNAGCGICWCCEGKRAAVTELCTNIERLTRENETLLIDIKNTHADLIEMAQTIARLTFELATIRELHTSQAGTIARYADDCARLTRERAELDATIVRLDAKAERLTRERDEALALRDGFKESRDHWKALVERMRKNITRAMEDIP